VCGDGGVFSRNANRIALEAAAATLRPKSNPGKEKEKGS
jgi:hypothetical protein